MQSVGDFPQGTSTFEKKNSFDQYVDLSRLSCL